MKRKKKNRNNYLGNIAIKAFIFGLASFGVLSIIAGIVIFLKAIHIINW